ncbi:MAG: hypothetical protein AAGL69_05970 [Pseudomonadota bacterium]
MSDTQEEILREIRDDIRSVKTTLIEWERWIKSEYEKEKADTERHAAHQVDRHTATPWDRLAWAIMLLVLLVLFASGKVVW